MKGGLVLASANPGKVRELRALLAASGVRLLFLADFPQVELPPEEGSTFAENATAKARFMARATGRWALADDSGLEVDALGGEPGVRSARFAGEGASDGDNIALLLRRLEGVPPERRGGRFRCVLALAAPDGAVETWEGRCEGEILTAPRGEGGFGYDPLFLVPSLGKTLAELAPAEKDRISHRGQALRRALPRLRVLAAG